jgi:hypothetical protein
MGGEGPVKTCCCASLCTHALLKGGDTPLHRSAREGSVGVVRALVEAGADAEALDEVRWWVRRQLRTCVLIRVQYFEEFHWATPSAWCQMVGPGTQAASSAAVLALPVFHAACLSPCQALLVYAHATLGAALTCRPAERPSTSPASTTTRLWWPFSSNAAVAPASLRCPSCAPLPRQVVPPPQNQPPAKTTSDQS